MVSVHTSDAGPLIVIRPNRSADWANNRRFLAALFLVSMMIGIGFSLIGAWVILPFAGLEVGAVASALYYVHWKLSYQQILTFSRETLTIDKGVLRPKQRWTMPRSEASVAVHAAAFPNDAPIISLCGRRDIVEIGEFLTEEEGQRLLKELRATGLRVRHHGLPGRRDF